MKLLRLSLVVVLPLFCACKQTTQVCKPPVAVVSNILSGAEAELASVLSLYDKTSSEGDITIIDSPERAAQLSEVMLDSDRFDNIDGSRSSDNLPDFAGERIVALMDIARDNYAQMDSMSLRDIAVRSTVAALDTRCCVSSYDTEYLSSKPTSKVVIISSPEIQAAGAYDIDTLMNATGVELPVIMPLRLMLSRSYGKGARNIGIITDGMSSISGAYDSICNEIAPAGSVHDCYVVSTDDLMGTDVLLEFLQSYKDAGNTAALDVLLIDTFHYTVDLLREEYTAILLDDNQENVGVRPLISKDFEFYSTASTVADECYALMRKRNIFTHDIHYPTASAYLTNPEMFQYALMSFDWNALPSGLESDLMNAAPQTYSAYVQNQHISGGN